MENKKIVNLFETPRIKRVANINGQLMEYTVFSYRRRVPDYDQLRYIGSGYIYSINGIKQTFTIKDKMHFWR